METLGVASAPCSPWGHEEGPVYQRGRDPPEGAQRFLSSLQNEDPGRLEEKEDGGQATSLWAWVLQCWLPAGQ